MDNDRGTVRVPGLLAYSSKPQRVSAVYYHNWHSTVGPLHEGMQFVSAHHSKVAMRLSVLSVVMTLAAQSMPGRLSVNVSQAGVVGEMVAKFQERTKWCSCLKTFGLRVCNLVLRPVDDRVHQVTRLEEAIRQIQEMQDEHQALHNSATWVLDLVLERSDKAQI
jgi:hypothetical protein